MRRELSIVDGNLTYKRTGNNLYEKALAWAIIKPQPVPVSYITSVAPWAGTLLAFSLEEQNSYNSPLTPGRFYGFANNGSTYFDVRTHGNETAVKVTISDDFPYTRWRRLTRKAPKEWIVEVTDPETAENINKQIGQ